MTTYRLKRNLLDRVFGGVCGGIGSYLGISGWWVRIAFLALILTSFSFGILLYLLLWISLPDQKLSDLMPILSASPAELYPRRYARPENVLLLGAFSIGIGIAILAETTGVLEAVGGDLLAPGMLLLIGIVLLLKHLGGGA